MSLFSRSPRRPPPDVPRSTAMVALPLSLLCRALRSAGFAAALLCALPACTRAGTAPSGASVPAAATGRPEYDRSFTELSELSRSVEAAERELPEVRSALARRLGLPGEAGADALGARLRERTARLASEGLTLELEFTGIEGADGADDATEPEPAAKSSSTIPTQPPPTPTATLRTPGREPERRELRLLEVMAQAALSAATIYAEMGTLARRTRPLDEGVARLRTELEQAFADPSQRSQVATDLDSAAALIAQLEERGRELAQSADTLVSLLDEAANTAGVARRRPPPASRNPAPRDPASPSERPPARPAAPRAPAETAPDFEP